MVKGCGRLLSRPGQRSSSPVSGLFLCYRAVVVCFSRPLWTPVPLCNSALDLPSPPLSGDMPGQVCPVRSVWTLAPATCYVLGPDPCVNFDPPSVLSLDSLPAPDAFELIVYCMHEDCFRTWVPRMASYDEVVGHLAHLWLDGCWPFMAAICSLLAWRGLSRGGCAGHFAAHLFCYAASIAAPDRVAPAHFRADLLGGRETRSEPGFVAVNGLPIRGAFSVRPGLSVVTVFPSGWAWSNWCLAEHHLADPYDHHDHVRALAGIIWKCCFYYPHYHHSTFGPVSP